MLLSSCVSASTPQTGPMRAATSSPNSCWTRSAKPLYTVARMTRALRSRHSRHGEQSLDQIGEAIVTGGKKHELERPEGPHLQPATIRLTGAHVLITYHTHSHSDTTVRTDTDKTIT